MQKSPVVASGGCRHSLHVRDRRPRRVIEADDFPGRRIIQQLARQFVVELVTGLVRRLGADQAVPEQIQITDRIENLVTHEFVVIAQPLVVEYAELVEHHGIVEAAAQGQIA